MPAMPAVPFPVPPPPTGSGAPTANRFVCPRCNNAHDPADQFCMHCGAQLVALVRRCGKCGAYPDATDRYCIFCGETLTAELASM